LRSTPGLGGVYRTPPRALLTSGELTFSRLDGEQLSLVSVRPATAADVAEATYGDGHGSRLVFESLGGYVDKSQIVQDWVGTTSLIPNAVPAYLVRIFDKEVVTVDPSNNHYWNVIVSATSGKIVSAFSYD
jgi:hypothetical protein